MRWVLITKATFLNYLECPTLSWFQLREQQEELTAGEELRILEGKELGTLARQVFDFEKMQITSFQLRRQPLL